MISSPSGELFSGGAFGLAVAVAGNNSHGEMNQRILRDYPRVCGEQVCMAFISVFVKRITPAYAGNRLYGSIFKSSKIARMFPKIH